MRNYRFYDEGDGNIIAIYLPAVEESININDTLEGFGALFYNPNSPVAWTGISRDYLRENCHRVSENRAREIHPELFKRLDE